MKIDLEGTPEEIEAAIKEYYIDNICGFNKKPNLCIKKLFDEAIDYNRITYDIDSKGELTNRLSVIATNALVNCHGESTQFIIEDTAGLLHTWFEEHGGEMPPNTSKLVMFVGSTKAMLGAY